MVLESRVGVSRTKQLYSDCSRDKVTLNNRPWFQSEVACIPSVENLSRQE